MSLILQIKKKLEISISGKENHFAIFKLYNRFKFNLIQSRIVQNIYI